LMGPGGNRSAPAVDERMPGVDPVAIEADLIIRGEHADPHHFLGVHSDGDGTVVRAYRPGAEAMAVILADGRRLEMTEQQAGCIFSVRLDEPVQDVLAGGSYDLEVRYPGDATF